MSRHIIRKYSLIIFSSYMNQIFLFLVWIRFAYTDYTKKFYTKIAHLYFHSYYISLLRTIYLLFWLYNLYIHIFIKQLQQNCFISQQKLFNFSCTYSVYTNCYCRRRMSHVFPRKEIHILKLLNYSDAHRITRYIY